MRLNHLSLAILLPDVVAFQPVQITNGPISGLVVRKNTTLQQPIVQDVEIFYGIRYAEPPLKKLRFRPPQPYTSEKWTCTRPMVTPGASCVRLASNFLGDTGDIIGQEDCLFLNVHRPSTAECGTSRLPVMFWIHRGGYVNGRGLSDNGTALAATHNVIVVTVNYRLGHLGFFGSQSSLSQEGTTGNWGTLDTQLGLKWVQQNIEAFGGDKNRVMLFGESAGAFTVMWHIAAPGSKGLFHSAIMQSGTTSTPLFFQNKADSFRYYDWVATELAGCQDANDLDCLRQVDPKKLAIPDGIRFDSARAPTWASTLFPNLPVGPTVDGVTLPDVPLRVVEKGDHNDVPLIVGFNRGEGSLFGFLLPRVVPGLRMPLRESGLRRSLNYFLQNETAAKEIEKFYPLEQYSSVYGPDNGPFEQAFAFMRDSLFHCPGRQLAEAQVKKGKSSTWMYSFDKPDLFGQLGSFQLGILSPAYGNLTVAQLSNFHSAELPFVFKEFSENPANFSRPSLSLITKSYTAHPPRHPGDSFHRISDAFSCMWTRMASHGSPTGPQQHCPGLPDGAIPSWLPYNSSLNGSQAQGVYMHIGDKLSMQAWRSNNIYPDNEMPSIEQCQLWNEHSFEFRNLRADLPGVTTASPTTPSPAPNAPTLAPITPTPAPTSPLSSAHRRGGYLLVLFGILALVL
ncbi:hypothetical protein FOZ60_002738 [Perkinsus olseni]|uniref:Carboxylic ester hydrolase n=3 Tax=Perkinsus olseni TaxID=32597 RepID=A0A7J6PJV2_PEROL|nr:hypothetical protein FOZ60_002738 [Perkinsus olseni]